MILQELHGASSNQPAATLHSETPSGELWKLLAPPWHCFSAAPFNSVFSLTLARSPMASRSYRRASDFLNYSPGLASDILAEWKSGKFFFTRFF